MLGRDTRISSVKFTAVQYVILAVFLVLAYGLWRLQVRRSDEFQTRAAPALSLTVVGAADLAKIDILKDSKVVATLQPQGRRHEGTWTDPQPSAGVHYYYIRVMQKDGELAWASPLWIEYLN